jgi:hypothetical protein
MESIDEKIYVPVEDIPVLESHDPELSSSGISILTLKKQYNEHLDDIKIDDVDREQDAMKHLYKLYHAKFPWAPPALVKSFSIDHYDRAIDSLVLVE